LPGGWLKETKESKRGLKLLPVGFLHVPPVLVYWLLLFFSLFYFEIPLSCVERDKKGYVELNKVVLVRI
jgi:hypothetical protein